MRTEEKLMGTPKTLIHCKPTWSSKNILLPLPPPPTIYFIPNRKGLKKTFNQVKIRLLHDHTVASLRVYQERDGTDPPPPSVGQKHSLEKRLIG